MRPVASVTSIAAIPATARRAVRSTARRSMPLFWCCAPSHVANNTADSSPLGHWHLATRIPVPTEPQAAAAEAQTRGWKAQARAGRVQADTTESVHRTTAYPGRKTASVHRFQASGSVTIGG